VLYSLGYFGPPVRGGENSQSVGLPPSADMMIERFWKTLEEQTEQLLVKHADEVEAIAQALMQTGDLSHDEVMSLLGDNGYKQNAPSLRSQRAFAAAASRSNTRGLPAPVAASTGFHRGDTAPNPAVNRQPAKAATQDMLAPLKEAPAVTVEHTQPNPPVQLSKEQKK